MAFFRRRKRDEEPEELEETPERTPTTTGPYDIDDKPELGSRVDLGALRIPKIPGIQLRLELDRNTRVPMAATVTLQNSAVQLLAFAAPRGGGLWDEVRPELAASITENGGSVEESTGAFGPELLGTMPVTTPGGKGTNRVRFVGIDGPRWMLRATFSGQAAIDAEAAAELENLVRRTVVVRGNQARPPREYLPLEIPGAREKDEEKEDKPDTLGVLKRGPEMTETR